MAELPSPTETETITRETAHPVPRHRAELDTPILATTGSYGGSSSSRAMLADSVMETSVSTSSASDSKAPSERSHSAPIRTGPRQRKRDNLVNKSKAEGYEKELAEKDQTITNLVDRLKLKNKVEPRTVEIITPTSFTYTHRHESKQHWLVLMLAAWIVYIINFLCQWLRPLMHEALDNSGIFGAPYVAIHRFIDDITNTDDVDDVGDFLEGVKPVYDLVECWQRVENDDLETYEEDVRPAKFAGNDLIYLDPVLREVEHTQDRVVTLNSSEQTIGTTGALKYLNDSGMLIKTRETERRIISMTLALSMLAEFEQFVWKEEMFEQLQHYAIENSAVNISIGRMSVRADTALYVAAILQKKLQDNQIFHKPIVTKRGKRFYMRIEDFQKRSVFQEARRT